MSRSKEAISFRENLTPDQIQEYEKQMGEMRKLSEKLEDMVGNCREFLAMRGLLAEFEQKYGTLEPFSGLRPAEVSKEIQEEELKKEDLEKNNEVTLEQKEAREEEIRHSQKPLIL